MTQEEIRQAAIEYACDDTEAHIDLFVAGAEWAKTKMIDKATQWLVDHINDYVSEYNVHRRNIEYLFTDFKRAMGK